jgi:galactokinase
LGTARGSTRGHRHLSFEGSAHGRVNLVGEHTDYNGGLVLPTLIPQRTRVTVTPRGGREITLRSDAPGLATVRASLDALEPTRAWGDYVLGVAKVLSGRGYVIRGFDATVRSDVPVGAGLSSSAALMVAALRAMRAAFSLRIDDKEVAAVAHEAEYGFVGARVGTMDQLVCSLGRQGEALHIDTRDLRTTPVPLADLDMELAVVDSGIRHDHATGGYNTRRAECEDAARMLRVGSLRNVTDDVDVARLPENLARRVRHVRTENARVEAAVDAIRRGDVRALGETVSAAHASLRDDFEVSLPAIDLIVAAAQSDPDVHGARLTGGGFGGSVLLLARKGAGRAAALRAAAAGGGSARLVVPA